MKLKSLAIALKLTLLSILFTSCTAAINNFEQYQQRNAHKDSGPPKTEPVYPISLSKSDAANSSNSPAFYIYTPPKPRRYHNLTLLNDGRVLMTGGYDNDVGGALSRAEIFNPKTGLWKNVASMNTARYNHTATLLDNGKVLVTGGYNGGDLNSAELFDPTSESWSSAGSFNGARMNHTATLLNDGTVIIVGGSTASTAVNTVRVYTPTTNSWADASNSLSTSRYSHSATKLNNGKVLVVAGYGGASPDYLTSAELYDPDTQAWSAVSDITGARSGHTATLLQNGHVLIAGGTTTASASVNTSLTYDPSASMPNEWTVRGNMTSSRKDHSATVLTNGKVLVTGGLSSTGPTYLNSSEIYENGTWTVTQSSLNFNRADHKATLLNDGRVLVVAGFDGTSYLNSIEFYNPTDDEWLLGGGNLKLTRTGQQSALLNNGKILIAGGSINLTVTNKFEIYDPSTGLSETNNSNTLKVARFYHRMTKLLNGKILVTGGYTADYIKSSEIYDSNNNNWNYAAINNGNMSVEHGNHTATLLSDGKVLITGGAGVGIVARNTVELYDPSGDNNNNTGSWSTKTSMSSARVSHTATLLNDGTVLVVGGRDNSSTYLNSSEIYNATNNTWTSAGTFTGARNFHTATKLNDGRVLIVGGVNGAALSTTAIYTPGSGWSAGPNLNLARTYHSANLLSDGRVLVVGGFGAASNLSSAEIYNPTTNAWTLLSSNLLEGRAYHNGISLSDGRVLLINGWALHTFNNVDVFSLFTPITLSISGGTAPYTSEINGSAAAFTLPSSSDKIILYPSTSGTMGVYVEDSNTDRSNEVTFTVSP